MGRPEERFGRTSVKPVWLLQVSEVGCPTVSLNQCNKWEINKLKPFHPAPIYFIITFKINVTGKCLYFRNSSSPPAHIHRSGTQINIHRCLLGLGWFIGSTAVLLRTTRRSAFLSDSCNILCAHTHTLWWTQARWVWSEVYIQALKMCVKIFRAHNLDRLRATSRSVLFVFYEWFTTVQWDMTSYFSQFVAIVLWYLGLWAV